MRPDYFANRKLVEFSGGEVVPVRLDYLDNTARAGLDLNQLEEAFKAGVKTFLFSNPNNPTGVIYSKDEIEQIRVTVLFVQNLAVCFEITIKINDLLWPRFRETASFRCKIWRFYLAAPARPTRIR